MPLPSLPRPPRAMVALAVTGLLLMGLAGPGLVSAAGDGPTIAARALLRR